MGQRKRAGIPNRHPVRTVTIPGCSGGLNLMEEPIRLQNRESPELVNLWWEDGVLRSRPGQAWATAAIPPDPNGDEGDSTPDTNGEEEGGTPDTNGEEGDSTPDPNGEEGGGSTPDGGGDGGSATGTAPPVGYAVTEVPFHDAVFLHIGDGLYVLPGSDALTDGEGLPMPRQLLGGLPRSGGTFVRFGEDLYYKNRGGFFRISHDATQNSFSVVSVLEDAFTPAILINGDPVSGTGDLYQPENRLSPRKRICYNAACEEMRLVRLCDGIRRAFSLTTRTENETAAHYGALDGETLPRLRGVASVYVDGAFQERALYEADLLTGTVIFNAAPPAGSTVTFTVSLGILTYRLPIAEDALPLDAVEEVRVDGVVMRAAPGGDTSGGTEEGGSTSDGTEEDGDGEASGETPWDYTVDLEAGTVTFREAPPMTDPPSNNTVEITFRKANPKAMDAVMDCPFAAVYGSGVQLCMVLGGGAGQPNAVFWSGHTETGLDGSYWPMSQFLLVGDTEDSVTGFGRQYNDLMVFQSYSIGKLQSDVEEVEGRDTLSLRYRRVNDAVGCDCPGSIRLVGNNLIFCSTARGICRIRGTTSACENPVDVISRKVNGSLPRPGLLYDLRAAGKGEVCAHDDGLRYYLAVNGHVWLWDYSISSWQDPTWYYWTGIRPAAWFTRNGSPCHLNREGRVTRLGDTLSDYGAAIRKVYQFPVQHFGSYDRLKDVLTLIISVTGDAPAQTDLIYETDWESRKDLCPLTSPGRDRLTDRDLTQRDLSVPAHAAVFRRRPMCRHVRHFSLRLENCRAGDDLAVLTVEMEARLLGRDR